jgi:hypothetical protein
MDGAAGRKAERPAGRAPRIGRHRFAPQSAGHTTATPPCVASDATCAESAMPCPRRRLIPFAGAFILASRSAEAWERHAPHHLPAAPPGGGPPPPNQATGMFARPTTPGSPTGNGYSARHPPGAAHLAGPPPGDPRQPRDRATGIFARRGSQGEPKSPIRQRGVEGDEGPAPETTDQAPRPTGDAPAE